MLISMPTVSQKRFLARQNGSYVWAAVPSQTCSFSLRMVQVYIAKESVRCRFVFHTSFTPTYAQWALWKVLDFLIRIFKLISRCFSLYWIHAKLISRMFSLSSFDILFMIVFFYSIIAGKSLRASWKESWVMLMRTWFPRTSLVIAGTVL